MSLPTKLQQLELVCGVLIALGPRLSGDSARILTEWHLRCVRTEGDWSEWEKPKLWRTPSTCAGCGTIVEKGGAYIVPHCLNCHTQKLTYGHRYRWQFAAHSIVYGIGGMLSERQVEIELAKAMERKRNAVH